MYDLGPAASRMATLVDGVRDDQLSAPTPCPDWDVQQMLAHVEGLTLAFTAAAGKDMTDLTDRPPAGAPPVPLDAGWPSRIRAQLDTMVEAWRGPGAWQGTSRVGGVTAPAEQIGGFGFNELVVHGWDLARATGQAAPLDDESLQACYDFAVATTPPGGIADGPFGTPVDVPDSAGLWDRLVALRGRAPDWSPRA
jgi:uncharacterized protein (TIGR03086 family)